MKSRAVSAARPVAGAEGMERIPLRGPGVMKPLAIWWSFPAARGLHTRWRRLPGGKGTRSTHLICRHRMPIRPVGREDEITVDVWTAGG